MNTPYQIIVQKYGGSSLATVDLIKNVAQAIKISLKHNTKICVVASAMGHSTNELLRLAHALSPTPNKRELDMLISCGERSSMALLAMALETIQVKAISLTGSQSGIITDDDHRNASIIAVKPARVFAAFAEHDVVIVAGFQGVSLKREITTLKRGGSDTTAIALAAALKASCAEIYTDVEGVFEGDPRLFSNASKIDKMSFEEACGMTFYGARVLAHEALDLAARLNIAIEIIKTGSDSGTSIGKGDLEVPKRKRALAITHLRGVIQIELGKDRLISNGDAGHYFLAARMQDDALIAYASNDISQEFLHGQPVAACLALVTVHLSSSAGLLDAVAGIFPAFKQHNIKLHDAIFGGAKVFLVVDDENLSRSLELLSAVFLTCER